MNDKEFFSRQSSTCSNICRQIIFVLSGVTWGIIYGEAKFNISNKLIPVIIMAGIIVYLSIDVVQYLYSVIKLRKPLQQYKSIYRTDIDENEKIIIESNYQKARNRIERNVFALFIFKISILPIILLLLLYYFFFIILI